MPAPQVLRVFTQGRKPTSRWNRSGEWFDPIAELAEFSDHSGHALALRSLVNFGAPLFIPDSLVQNLPDQTAKPMSYERKSLIVPQTRHVTAIKDREDAPLLPGGGVSRLI